ncbi:9433_t:CDS:2 [Rhizophagus irregularis]|nr:9433_t:CDS:2 [Rhizophagus irregularis]
MNERFGVHGNDGILLPFRTHRKNSKKISFLYLRLLEDNRTGRPNSARNMKCGGKNRA